MICSKETEARKIEIKKRPEEIFGEYEKGVAFNKRIGDDGLYEAVERYENFYIGRQWEGVNAPDLEKPVLNFTHRVVSYCISMLVADDVGVSLAPFRRSTQREAMCRVLSDEVTRVVERCRLKTEAREALRSCAVDGDTALYFYLDEDQSRGEAAVGEIACMLVENTKVIFGNPYNPRVEGQPFIILVMRRQVQEAREMAKKNGAGKDAVDAIRPDSESNYGETDAAADDLTTTLIKMWKEDGKLCWMEVCRHAVLQKERTTERRRYPIAWMNWESVRGSYHGHGVMEGMIPNQIFVNKLWAMMMVQVKNMAFPKVLYDGTLIKTWTNKVGDAIRVNGSVDKAVAQNLRGGDFSAQAMELVEKTISYTKDYMGANDVALGNVTPDNAAAIIATSKASSAPLELQRLAYFQLMEDCVRIIADQMASDYGMRTVSVDGETAVQLGALGDVDPAMVPDQMDIVIDFADMNLDEMELNVDVGTSAYWSELAQQQSADNLLKAGIIKDAADYVERIPDKWIKNKAGLLKKLKEQQQQMTQQAQAMGGGQLVQMNGGGMNYAQ